MKKRTIYLMITAILVCVLSTVFSLSINAASASLWFTDPTVTVGKVVSVIVEVKGADIGGYEMNISYDTERLRFETATTSTGGSLSCSSNTTNGVLRIAHYDETGSANSLSFMLTFTTLKTGSAKLKPSEYLFFDGSGDPITPGAIGDSTIKINPAPVASSDATLKGLSISPGTLYPVFDPSVTNYTVTVAPSVNSVAVTALCNHAKAMVAVSGTDNLVVGKNTVSVTVTAENGTTKVYTIDVTRNSAVQLPPNIDEAVYVTLPDGNISIVAQIVDQSIVPPGFVLTKILFDDKEYDAISYAEDGKPAVYLPGDEVVKAGFYFVDIETKTVSPLEYQTEEGREMTLLDISEAEIPEGYQIGKYQIGDTEKSALVPTDSRMGDHCLVYALGPTGQPTLYVYDPVEKSFQRFGTVLAGSFEEETTQPDQTNQTPNNTDQPQTDNQNTDGSKSLFSNKIFLWSFIGVCIAIVIFIGVALIINTKYS